MSSWRDDFDLEPNTHPTIAYALLSLRGKRAAEAAQQQANPRWPFPTQPIPPDKRKPPPTHPDAEEAPW